jgi:hypothetical protein
MSKKKSGESPAMKAWENTPAGKADDKADRKKGVKERSAKDRKLDAAAMKRKK